MGCKQTAKGPASHPPTARIPPTAGWKSPIRRQSIRTYRKQPTTHASDSSANEPKDPWDKQPKTTKHLGKTTKHLDKTTKHLGKTTKHLDKTTKHLGKTTKHLERTTRYLVSRKCPTVFRSILSSRKRAEVHYLITHFSGPENPPHPSPWKFHAVYLRIRVKGWSPRMLHNPPPTLHPASGTDTLAKIHNWRCMVGV